MVAVSCRIPCKEQQGQGQPLWHLCPLKQHARTFASSCVRAVLPPAKEISCKYLPFFINVFSLLSIHPRHALPSPLLQLPQTATNCALHRPAIKPVLFLLLTRAAYSLLCVLFVVVDRQSSQNLSLHHAFIFRRPPLDHLDG